MPRYLQHALLTVPLSSLYAKRTDASGFLMHAYSVPTLLNKSVSKNGNSIKITIKHVRFQVLTVASMMVTSFSGDNVVSLK
jgi:hypothetical protein